MKTPIPACAPSGKATEVPRRPPICSDCRVETFLSPNPDAVGEFLWRCPACDAAAACVPGTLRPGSEPAGEATRALRTAAYVARRDAIQRLRQHLTWRDVDREIAKTVRRACGKWKNIGFSDAAQAQAMILAYQQL